MSAEKVRERLAVLSTPERIRRDLRRRAAGGAMTLSLLAVCQWLRYDARMAGWTVAAGMAGLLIALAYQRYRRVARTLSSISDADVADAVARGTPCSSCGDILLQDEPNCSRCGAARSPWTLRPHVVLIAMLVGVLLVAVMAAQM